MRRQRKIKLQTFLVQILMTLSTFIFAGAVHAREEVGGCELAMGLCVHYTLLWGYSNDTMVNCMIGYAFCKKYVESS